MPLVSGYYQSRGDQGRESSMNNPSLVSAKYLWAGTLNLVSDLPLAVYRMR
jgi:hypothetical protein